MAAEPILTDQLAQRLAGLLRETDGGLFSQFTTAEDAQSFARKARELGIGIVDIENHRSWIDERVHHGVLLRLADARQALAGAETHGEFDQ